MKIRFNIYTILVISILSFNGCTTAIDKIEPVKVGTAGLTEKEQNEILYYVMNERNSIEYPEKSYAECAGRKPCSVKLSIYFHIENGNLILKDESKCSLIDAKIPSKCLSGNSYNDYVTFANLVDKNKALVEQKLPLLMSEYATVKTQITNWLNIAKNKKAQFVFENKNTFALSDEVLNKLIENARFDNSSLERLTPIEIFMQYKNSNTSIESFLNNYVIATYRPYDKLNYGHFSLISPSQYEGTVVSLNVKDFDSPLVLKHTAAYYNFMPAEYTIKDKNISARFVYSRAYFRVTITNLTNDYIEIDAASYYYDKDSNNEFTIGNKSVPPQGKNDSITVKIDPIQLYYGRILSSQDKITFGAAISYTLKDKTIKNTLSDKLDVKLGDFEKVLFK